MKSEHVVINGIRYIPAKESVVNLEAVARALLMEYWGDVTDKQLAEFMEDESLRIIIVDDGDPEYTSFPNFLDNLTESL